MMPGKFSVIILAAGLSSRMGRSKPLLPMGDRTLLEQVIAIFKTAGIQDLKVVVGFHRKKIDPLLKRLRVAPVVNPDFREGMFSSVISGVSALDPLTEAAFIHPVDIPLIRASTVSRLLDVYRNSPGRIVRPCFNEKRGHPPLIPHRYFRHILSWSGQGGLKAVLAKFESDALTVPVPDPDILFDIDTPDDYKTALEKWQRRNPENKEGP